ncbi:unnamed protein product [Linum trigynum]|uniref:Uncharacterized protein n=1 Tax=Linum trigynum TaxID=586398 RepID=A0AAV2GQL8_9ROSI
MEEVSAAANSCDELPASAGIRPLTNSCPRGHWRPAEDEKLRQLVEQFGAQNWNSIADKLQGRSGKSCRLRWFNQLDPKINTRPFTEAEEERLLTAHRIHGNKWSLIARLFPGRTDNAVKNHCHVLTTRRQREQHSKLHHYQQARTPWSMISSSNHNVNVNSNNLMDRVIFSLSPSTINNSSSTSTSFSDNKPLMRDYYSSYCSPTTNSSRFYSSYVQDPKLGRLFIYGYSSVSTNSPSNTIARGSLWSWVGSYNNQACRVVIPSPAFGHLKVRDDGNEEKDDTNGGGNKMRKKGIGDVVDHRELLLLSSSSRDGFPNQVMTTEQAEEDDGSDNAPRFIDFLGAGIPEEFYNAI